MPITTGLPLTRPYAPHTPQSIETADGDVLRVPATMTVEEFLAFPWPEGQRWELIEGTPVMSPSPTVYHQDLLLCLAVWLRLNLHGFKVVPGVDVWPPESRSYVCPDLVAISMEGWEEFPVRRTPCLAVEVLSPSTQSVDLGPKLHLFERIGLAEYWVADPRAHSLTVRVLGREGGAYEVVAPSDDGFVQSPIARGALRLRWTAAGFELLRR